MSAPIPLLQDILVIAALAIGVMLAGQALRVPAVVGFLLTGALAGPHGLGLVASVHDVEILAEIGVILLLFTIGIEFSLKNLLQIRRAVLRGGGVQLALTVGAVALVAWPLGAGPGRALFYGCLAALSSTAIVLQVLQQRAEVETPHGRNTVGILILQDLAIVPMVLLVPVLKGQAAGVAGFLALTLVKAAGVLAVVWAAARWVLPWLLFQVARTRSRELFLLATIALCLATAWLTSQVGLSLALGAFIAGLVLSESEYGNQVLGNMLPFRDTFTSFFFVSVGMLLDGGFLFRHPGLVAAGTLGVVLLKALTGTVAARAAGAALRSAAVTGIGLAQVGEFAFVLAKEGAAEGLLSAFGYQLFLAVSVLTMAAAPYLLRLAPAVAEWLASRGRAAEPPPEGSAPGPATDLLIVGYGVTGRHLAQAARAAHIRYAVLEMNPETVRRERARGEPLHFGDATQDTVLLHAGVGHARVVVVAVNDPAATRRITAAAHRLNPSAALVVRTRFLQEMLPLYELGAQEVIPEELEAAVVIFDRVLTRFLVPPADVQRMVREIRADGYQMLRRESGGDLGGVDLATCLAGLQIAALRVPAGAPAAGRTLGELALRRRHGITVLTLRKRDRLLANPGGEARLEAGDVAVVLGAPEDLAGALKPFEAPPAEAPPATEA